LDYRWQISEGDLLMLRAAMLDVMTNRPIRMWRINDDEMLDTTVACRETLPNEGYDTPKIAMLWTWLDNPTSHAAAW